MFFHNCNYSKIALKYSDWHSGKKLYAVSFCHKSWKVKQVWEFAGFHALCVPKKGRMVMQQLIWPDIADLKKLDNDIL